MILQGTAIKESGVKTVPLEREIISISPLLLVSFSQGSIYTHAAAQQVLPLFLFPAKAIPELQSHCPANPTSWHKDLGIRQEWDFWLVQGIHLFHTQLSSGIPWPWDDQLVRISLRIYMYWSEIDLRLGWEMVYSVRDNSVFMGQG